MNSDLSLLRDPRIRSVEWRDLTKLSRREVVSELLLSLPWWLASLYFAHQTLYPLALLCSFFFFLTGLRQVHNAYHYTLGIPRAACEWIMVGLSVLMLGSMHAVQSNHLRHHKDCLGPDDIEGHSARLSLEQALLMGPVFPIRLHLKALQVANRKQRAWIYAELGANVIWIALVFGLFDYPALRYHVIVMAVGQCLTSLVAVWSVHHDLDETQFIARTLRHPWLNAITYNMFYHVEHHLFPQVPTCHLPELARRLDQVAPELQTQQVLEYPGFEQ